MPQTTDSRTRKLLLTLADGRTYGGHEDEEGPSEEGSQLLICATSSGVNRCPGCARPSTGPQARQAATGLGPSSGGWPTGGGSCRSRDAPTTPVVRCRPAGQQADPGRSAGSDGVARHMLQLRASMIVQAPRARAEPHEAPNRLWMADVIEAFRVVSCSAFDLRREWILARFESDRASSLVPFGLRKNLPQSCRKCPARSSSG
jgi:hypothetical protein